MGQSRTLIHKSPARGLNHNMSAYIDAMQNRVAGLGHSKTMETLKENHELPGRKDKLKRRSFSLV